MAFSQDLKQWMQDPTFAAEYGKARNRVGRIQALYRRFLIKAGLEGKAFYAQKVTKSERRQMEHLMRQATGIIDKEIEKEATNDVVVSEP